MSEDKLYDEVLAGRAARDLLDNEALKGALTYLEQCYIDVLKVAKTPEAREACWHNWRGLQRFQEHLTAVASNGRLADAQIAEMVRAQKREKKYG